MRSINDFAESGGLRYPEHKTRFVSGVRYGLSI